MPATRLGDRALVRLAPAGEGEDVAQFLQALVTNDVAGPYPVYAGLLTPQGKTLFDFLVWRDGDDLLLDCAKSVADELVRRLGRYRLRRRIDIAVDPELAVHWDPEETANGVPDPRLSALGRRWLSVALSGEGAADADWLAHRLSLGVTEGHDELGDILWLETNATELNGVSFTKGCYIGQENTARMNWRQKINRRLVVVPIERSDERRRKAAYPALGLAVDHRRTEDIDVADAPAWLRAALAT